MPNRILREGILTSDRIDQLDAAAEVFYRRLMSKVDDYGLHDARPAILRSFLYPLRADRVREADIARWIAACEKAGVIALYEHDGKPYLQMLDTEWQTRSEPKCPLPPWGKGKPLQTVARNCKQTTATDTVFGVGVGDEGDKPAGRPMEGLFEQFYKAYPRKAKPKDARKAWDKIKPDAALLATMLRAIEDQKATPQWQKEGGQFIPYPASWLNSEEWKNEVGPAGESAVKPWHDTRAGIEAKGEELGLGRWDQAAWERGEREAWPQYEAKVFKAAGHSPRAAA